MGDFVLNEVLNRFKANEKTALDELFGLYRNRIFNFSLSYLKNEDDAYDLVQEVFIALWENRKKIDNTLNFDAFIFTIARNKVLTLFRKRLSDSKYMQYLQENFVEYDFDVDAIIDYNELNSNYKLLVEKLPPKRREIFLLCREKGLSYKEVAAMKNISEKTIDDHMRKALEFIRANLTGKSLSAILFYFLFVLR